MLLLLAGCSKDSEPGPLVENTVVFMYVDQDGNNLFDNKTDLDEVKVVWFDSDGTEHDFYDPDLFGTRGFTVNPFEHTFTLYLALPGEGSLASRTYMRFYDLELDTFDAQFEHRKGETIVKSVTANGELIWERGKKYENYPRVVKQVSPAAGD